MGKMWNYYPQYFTKLAFLSVPYQPPAPFDLGESTTSEHSTLK
jgi:hypothetical protein